ncbi:MAG TPA: hypothetical protein VN734_11130 [Acidobacteriaceae bacterium]|nr:hypothetical protein [Acidobacteriaceae bacterium]
MPRPALVVLSVFLFGSLSACKVSDDAIAASHQMTSTAAALNDFYSTLEDAVTDTITLYELDDALSGIPFRDNDRKLQETTRSELENRKEMAAALAKLAASFATLTNSSSASDVDKSATALGNQLITIKALPSGSPVPGALGKAANALMQIVQQHDEKKAARAIDETLQAVGDLFEAEKPVYDSIARTQIRQAGEVAKTLIDANQVDYTSMLTPALKPFSLSELPSNAILQAQLKPLALSRLDTATGIAVHSEEKASTAMLDALREMSSRVHLLATEKPMPIRDAPFSLKLVEDWVQSWAASLI